MSQYKVNVSLAEKNKPTLETLDLMCKEHNLSRSAAIWEAVEDKLLAMGYDIKSPVSPAAEVQVLQEDDGEIDIPDFLR